MGPAIKHGDRIYCRCQFGFGGGWAIFLACGERLYAGAEGVVVADIFGFDAVVTFFPGMIHGKLEICQCVGGGSALVPIGTCVREHAGAFKGRQY